MNAHTVETTLGGRKFSIQTGVLAKQAQGSVMVRYGDTMVLVTACVAPEPRAGIDFFPLTVDYIEKTYAAGKIPGGFFKREGRPKEKETLTSRFIDRPIRPLFADGFKNETQIIATVVSADNDNNPDMVAMIGASAALTLSNAPFLGPIAGVTVGRVDGTLICNPTPEQQEQSDMEVVVAGSRNAIVMVEGGAQEVSEEDMLQAILFAHKEMQCVLDIQEELQRLAGKEKMAVVLPEVNTALETQVKDAGMSRLKEALTIADKQERYATLDAVKKEILEAVTPEDDDGTVKGEASGIVGKLKSDLMRGTILSDKVRIDGRDLTTVRPISIEAGLLPRVHGSAVFTRGETQALVTATLGTSDDQQMMDDMSGTTYKDFMLHYNFPPFCVGEVKFLRSAGRREIGHGALAERSVLEVMPKNEDFPYTVRIVSEILESNGSSSMASVCGASLALMDAGVPIQAPVAGVAMGLIMEGEEYAILTDILGDEDHLGDMDFKVAGTEKGITALQMDIKIQGLSENILREALDQAHSARLHILGEMGKAVSTPRESVSQYAPKMTSIVIDKEKIGALIGPGGKMIRGIQEQTGAKIDIEEDGTVFVAAIDQAAGDQALKMIKAVTATPQEGKFYRGIVQKTLDFGAFVEILPGTDGLVHISQLAEERVKETTDVLSEGDELIVKVLEIDPKNGKIRLSRKEALEYDGPLEND